MNKSTILKAFFQKKHLFFYVAVALFLSACGEYKNTESSSGWVEDEVLMQLQELKKEIIKLNKKIDNLTNEIGEQKIKQAKRSGKYVPESIALSGAPKLGESSAKIAVVEFTDYECPFCLRHHKTVYPKIKKNYVDTGKIQYLVRHYPLDFHRKAKLAAVAANCANEQNKFWSMHHQIFSNQKNLEKEFYIATSDKLGMDTNKFTKCIDDKQNLDKVNHDIAFGEEAGVAGTPRFYVGEVAGNKIVNVKMISGAAPYTNFVNTINKALQRK